MQTSHQATAHSLYVLYQALPKQSQQLFLQEKQSQQLFLQEMLTNQAEVMEDTAIYLVCEEARNDDDFLTDDECRSFVDGLLHEAEN
jgi:hypothetical protein